MIGGPETIGGETAGEPTLKAILAITARRLDRQSLVSELSALLRPTLGFSWLTLLPLGRGQGLMADFSLPDRPAINPFAPLWPDSLTAVIGRHISETGEPVVIPDCSKYFSGAVTPPVFQHPAACLIALPLTVGGRILGVLECAWDRPRDGIYKLASFLRELTPAVAASLALTLASEDAAAEAAARPPQRTAPEGPFLESDLERPVGRGPAMRRLLDRLERVAGLDVPILLLGETGVGKTLLARHVHDLSRRREAGFVTVNCPSLTPSLFESEMFGHAKGAFTGAASGRVGRLGLADKGTLFLDEIAELAPELQSKLLHALETNRFERVGESRSMTVDVRLITATNVDLDEALRDGRLRRDLLHRVGVFTATVPPLRERLEDLPELAAGLSSRAAARLSVAPLALGASMLGRLAAHDWPGNVRELNNVLCRLLIHQAASGPPDERALEECLGTAPGYRPSGSPLQEAREAPGTSAATAAPRAPATLAQLEREHIERALRLTGGRVAGAKGAAALLAVPRSTLLHRMKRLGVRRG